MSIAIAMLFLLPTAGNAVAINQQIVSMEVEAGGHTAQWSLILPVTTDPYSWTLEAPINIYSSDEVLLGTLDGLTIGADTDPFVTLGFAVSAGALPTNFTINSVIVNFAPIINGQAFATAAITASEGGPNLDGATLTGLFPGTKAYQAQYNGMTGIFANLISPVAVAPSGLSATNSERFPPIIGTRVPIAGAVSDIESSFSFTLSAFDLASGTGRFDIIVPEPSSFVLTTVAGVALAWQVWRRRRRA